MLTRYLVIHDRNTRYREVDAENLNDVYLWANATFGNTYAKGCSRNARPRSKYKVYDNTPRIVKVLYPNVKWSGHTVLDQGFAPLRRRLLGDELADALGCA